MNEEFFHAYQNHLHGRRRMARIGGSNIELEPKFLDMYKRIHNGHDEPIPYMPGQVRMINLLMQMDNSATRLTASQQRKYLQAVEEFRRHWETINRATDRNNMYDDPKTPDGPNAAFDLINRVRNGHKK